MSSVIIKVKDKISFYMTHFLLLFCNQGVHEPKTILVLAKMAKNLPPWPNEWDISIEKGVPTN